MLREIKEKCEYDKERQGRYQEDPKQNFRDEKYNIFNEKYTDGIHSRLGTAEEKIAETDDTSVETIQNETQKRQNKNIGVSVSCRMASNDLKIVYLE